MAVNDPKGLSGPIKDLPLTGDENHILHKDRESLFACESDRPVLYLIIERYCSFAMIKQQAMNKAEGIPCHM